MVQSKEAHSPAIQGLGMGSLGEFPATAPAAAPVFYRTYSRRRPDSSRETWSDVCDRTLADIARLGRFTPQERELVERLQRQLKALISGRALWVMGTDWIQKPENYSGAYNCTSLTVVDWRSFGLMMDLAMMGCGTGAVLEPQFISQLPPILNRLEVQVVGSIGATPPEARQEHTRIQRQGSRVHIQVGDSRRGWVESYQALLELAADPSFGGSGGGDGGSQPCAPRWGAAKRVWGRGQPHQAARLVPALCRHPQQSRGQATELGGVLPAH